MYEHNANQLIMPDKFFLPFGRQLKPDNLRVVMASLIPWSEIELNYVQSLGDINQESTTNLGFIVKKHGGNTSLCLNSADRERRKYRKVFINN